MAKLSEKEIAAIIETHVWADGDDSRDFILGVPDAAHAIAKEMREGAYTGTGMVMHDVDQEGNAEVYILLDSEPRELDSGQRVTVTVTKEE